MNLRITVVMWHRDSFHYQRLKRKYKIRKKRLNNRARFTFCSFEEDDTGTRSSSFFRTPVRSLGFNSHRCDCLLWIVSDITNNGELSCETKTDSFTLGLRSLSFVASLCYFFLSFYTIYTASCLSRQLSLWHLSFCDDFQPAYEVTASSGLTALHFPLHRLIRFNMFFLLFIWFVLTSCS